MSSTLGIVRSRSRLWGDFEVFLHLPKYKLSSPIPRLQRRFTITPLAITITPLATLRFQARCPNHCTTTLHFKSKLTRQLDQLFVKVSRINNFKTFDTMEYGPTKLKMPENITGTSIVIRNSKCSHHI